MPCRLSNLSLLVFYFAENYDDDFSLHTQARNKVFIEELIPSLCIHLPILYHPSSMVNSFCMGTTLLLCQHQCYFLADILNSKVPPCIICCWLMCKSVSGLPFNLTLLTYISLLFLRGALIVNVLPLSRCMVAVVKSGVPMTKSSLPALNG